MTERYLTHKDVLGQAFGIAGPDMDGKETFLLLTRARWLVVPNTEGLYTVVRSATPEEIRGLIDKHPTLPLGEVLGHGPDELQHLDAEIKRLSNLRWNVHKGTIVDDILEHEISKLTRSRRLRAEADSLQTMSSVYGLGASPETSTDVLMPAHVTIDDVPMPDALPLRARLVGEHLEVYNYNNELIFQRPATSEEIKTIESSRKGSLLSIGIKTEIMILLRGQQLARIQPIPTTVAALQEFLRTVPDHYQIQAFSGLQPFSVDAVKVLHGEHKILFP